MSRRGTSPGLIGRGEQMAALEAAFAAVQRGGPSAVLVGGEAGVGKTRLVSEFTDTPIALPSDDAASNDATSNDAAFDDAIFDDTAAS